jgi:DNA-binding protein HU-beta
VNRSDLVATIAERIGDKKKAKQAVDALVEAITDAVARGEKVAVEGLGTFERAYRAASTGEKAGVAGVTVPKFEPAKGFKVLVDEAKDLGVQAIAVAAAAVSEGKKAAKVREVASKAQQKAVKKYGAKARPTTPPAKPEKTAPAAAAPAAAAPAAASSVPAPAKKATPARKTAARKTTAAKKTTTPRTTAAAKKTTTPRTTTAAKKTTTPRTTTAAKKTTTPRTTTAAKKTSSAAPVRRPAVRSTPLPTGTGSGSTAGPTAGPTTGSSATTGPTAPPADQATT